MTVIRAFIAIELPLAVQQRLDALAAALRPKLPAQVVRWTAARNIHLTLMFLGDVSVTNLAAIKAELQSEAEQHQACEMVIANLGAFPSLQKPRVVWVGVQAPPTLLALQSGVEQRMKRLGYAADERPFSPHLTLGRVERSALPAEVRQLGQVIGAQKVGVLGAAPVLEVALVQSDLRAGGAVYTTIGRAPLKT